MSECDFNKVALLYLLRHGCSPVNLLQIFRTPFRRNTSAWLFLIIDFKTGKLSKTDSYLKLMYFPEQPPCLLYPLHSSKTKLRKKETLHKK